MKNGPTGQVSAYSPLRLTLRSLAQGRFGSTYALEAKAERIGAKPRG